MADHDGLADCSISLRLRSVADLAEARHTLAHELESARIEPGAVDDLVLACSELFTNALEAAEPGTDVSAVVSVAADPRAEVGRRVTVEVVNIGDPLPGRLEVDGASQIGPNRSRGRGLVLAAQMGDLVLEGLIGGTRARFERRVHLAT
ncbi:MAG: hypothetical protein HKN41_06745 [Ilumatobacter sp.]|nr:hypothetical protein [Ilumatobacter sp.]